MASMLPSSADDRPAVWLRAAIPPSGGSFEIGWIGGNPKLPEPFVWPTSRARNLDFLCQINCACLPGSLWNGLGPKSGWLAFFCDHASSQTAIIWAPQLGPERLNDQGWSKDGTALHRLNDRFAEFLGPPPAWPLRVVEPTNFESPVPHPLRRRQNQRAHVELAAPENHPFDRRSLIALLSVAMFESEHRLVRIRKSRREAELNSLPPPDELLAAIDDMMRTADHLKEAIAADAARQPTDHIRWMTHRELLIRLRLAKDEISLQTGQNFHKATADFHVGDHVGAQSLLDRKTLMPGTTERRLYDELTERIRSLRDDLNTDSNVPQSSDTLTWRIYRHDFPVDWAAYAERIRRIGRLRYRLWADLGGNHNLDWTPRNKTHEQAIVQAGLWRKWASDERKRVTSRRESGRSEMLRRDEAKKDEAEEFHRKIQAIAASVSDLPPDHVFVPEAWTPVYRLFDDAPERTMSWNWETYFRIRSELAKPLYAVNPAALKPDIRESLEARWASEAEQATIQLGGVPRGEVSRRLKHILLQFPTNELTNHSWRGNDLVVSIDDDDLARGAFDNAANAGSYFDY